MKQPTNRYKWRLKDSESDFFLPLVDAALTASRERFHILDKHNKLLGFFV